MLMVQLDLNQAHYPITIKEGAYIGMRASIISKKVGTNGQGKEGITIGKNAIIGACALVNIDVPDNTTVVGVPCRIVHPKNE